MHESYLGTVLDDKVVSFVSDSNEVTILLVVQECASGGQQETLNQSNLFSFMKIMVFYAGMSSRLESCYCMGNYHSIYFHLRQQQCTCYFYLFQADISLENHSDAI